jgi:hypothetical protein
MRRNDLVMMNKCEDISYGLAKFCTEKRVALSKRYRIRLVTGQDPGNDLSFSTHPPYRLEVRLAEWAGRPKDVEADVEGGAGLCWKIMIHQRDRIVHGADGQFCHRERLFT